MRSDPKAAEHLHGIRHHLNAGADPGEFGCLLVDQRFKTCPSQRRGDRKPSHASADDGNRHVLSAHAPLRLGLDLSVADERSTAMWQIVQAPNMAIRRSLPPAGT